MEIGERFGKLTIISIDEKGNVECMCDCGNKISCKHWKLTANIKPLRSCGCLRLERVHESKTVHGQSGGLICGQRTKLYRTWSNMKSRCYNPKVRSYSDYGAKGIRVCDEWLNDFVAFSDWAVKNGYDESDKSLVIDRIDPNDNYCPENCRWISAHENNIRARVKTCWAVNISTGEKTKFTNIKEFAENNGFDRKIIDRVLYGKAKSHNGYYFYYA